MLRRKRKSGKESTETPTTGSEAPATTATEAPIAEAPVAEAPAAAAAEPPAPEAKPEGKSFADKVPQRKWVPDPDPFGIAGDNLARVQLFESKMDRQVAIKFGDGRPEDKPSQAVIDKLKEAGYRWNPTHRVWTHPLRADSEKTTRIDANELYQEVRRMIRKEKGIDAEEQGIPL